MECNNFIQQRFELVLTKYLNFSLREKYPNKEFFLAVFSSIWTEYGPVKTTHLETFYGGFYHSLTMVIAEL